MSSAGDSNQSWNDRFKQNLEYVAREEREAEDAESQVEDLQEEIMAYARNLMQLSEEVELFLNEIDDLEQRLAHLEGIEDEIIELHEEFLQQNNMSVDEFIRRFEQLFEEEEDEITSIIDEAEDIADRIEKHTKKAQMEAGTMKDADDIFEEIKEGYSHIWSIAQKQHDLIGLYHEHNR